MLRKVTADYGRDEQAWLTEREEKRKKKKKKQRAEGG